MSVKVKRLDFMPIEASKEDLAHFRKIFSDKMRESRNAAKSETCLLCGRPQTSYCNSHCLPQFCLREIARGGEVLTLNEFIGLAPMDNRKGVKQAGTFHNICRSCDSDFFADYENPEAYGSEINQKMMGQIAVKCALLEYGKASEQIKLDSSFQGNRPYFEAHEYVRTIDAREQLENLRLAKRAAQAGSRVFRCIWQHTSGHVAPFAFQGAISLIAGYRCELINNTINPSPDYKLVPLYICVFPIAGKTHVILFVRNDAKRYRHFIADFQALGTDEKLQDVCRLIIANNEDVFFSPAISPTLKSDGNLIRLARMTSQQLFVDSDETPGAKLTAEVARASVEQFMIPKLPLLPNLFSADYRIG